MRLSNNNIYLNHQEVPQAMPKKIYYSKYIYFFILFTLLIYGVYAYLYKQNIINGTAFVSFYKQDIILQQNGYINKIYIFNNERVKENQLLLSIYKKPLLADIDLLTKYKIKIDNLLKQKKIVLDSIEESSRHNQLYLLHLVNSKINIKELNIRLKNINKQIKTYKKFLRENQLQSIFKYYAPISGYISDLHIKPHQYFLKNSRVLAINNNDLIINGFFNNSKLPFLLKNNNVEIILPTKEIIKGYVSKIESNKLHYKEMLNKNYYPYVPTIRVSIILNNKEDYKKIKPFIEIALKIRVKHDFFQ